jgi:5-methylcytosine-specific restriction endonuclease McrA
MARTKTFKYYSPRIKPTKEEIAESNNPNPPIRKSKTTKKPLKKKDKFYMSWSWRKIRLLVIQREEGRCNICGRTINDLRDDGVSKVKISVDHILPRSTHQELELDVNNLRVLCHDCHEALNG